MSQNNHHRNDLSYLRGRLKRPSGCLLVLKVYTVVNLTANPTAWSSTLKQFVSF